LVVVVNLLDFELEPKKIVDFDLKIRESSSKKKGNSLHSFLRDFVGEQEEELRRRREETVEERGEREEERTSEVSIMFEVSMELSSVVDQSFVFEIFKRFKPKSLFDEFCGGKM
jgi:hypothetical protein